MVSTGMGGGEPGGMPPAEAGFCVQCGTAFAAGQHYCGRCGQPLAAVTADDRMTAGVPPGGGAPGGLADVPAGSGPLGTAPLATGPRADGPPFDAAVVIGAVILTVLFPFIALIVALVLRSREVIQSRRQFLKNWAIGSAAWLCTGWLIALIVFASAGPAHPASCKGGIDQLTPPTYVSSDGKHWTATYTCENGGTTTRRVPASQVPGGGM